MDFQYYPTPFGLAQKAWAMFQNKNIVRLLEPSAGTGSLLKAMPHQYEYGRIKIDACEIDPQHHANLLDLDLRVKISLIGYDFMQLKEGCMYSHVVMNPPFADGAKHVLKAWELVHDAEIVAIINAETIRNPFSQERAQLVELINRHGRIEYVQDAFVGDDVFRQTKVEIALVWLQKTAEAGSFDVDNILKNMREDQSCQHEPKFERTDLAIPANLIENYVLMFNEAVSAARESVRYQALASHFAGRLGKPMAEINTQQSGSAGAIASDKTLRFGDAYDDLKDRAWANVLRTSDITKNISVAARKKIDAEFERIKKMQFTTDNIYGFLQGILESMSSIQNDMICEIFDLFSRYHSENVCYYRGWKSNDKHRTLGMKLKSTRFVLPHCGESYWKKQINYDAKRMCADIDRVFSILDGKSQPEISLNYLFDTYSNDLCNGTRVSGSYFDARFYPGIGTIHLFPKRKDLVDRLNRVVGSYRQWLPPSQNDVASTFWQQYENAESFEKNLKATDLSKTLNRLQWMSPENKAQAIDKADAILAQVHMKNGIHDFLLTDSSHTKPVSNQQLFLLAA